MCGIIGIIGREPVTPLLIDALRRLEYRGYDSAGVATLMNGHIGRRRAEGKLVNLEARLTEDPLPGTIGIGHTRWATHGKPSERNAHPIATDRVAVVHNGIIENFQELKDELIAEGCTFESDTDTEVVAQLMTCLLNRQMKPEEAMQSVMDRLRGAFALVVLISGRHDILLGARRGSPLAIGCGEGAMYLGTDAVALAPFTKQVVYLEDGDWTVLTHETFAVYQGATPVARTATAVGLDAVAVGKGNYSHFMLKEIYEQPTALGETLKAYLDPAARSVALPSMPMDWCTVTDLRLIACGTSLYACMVGAYWFERLARIPALAEMASEFRDRDIPFRKGGVCIAVSQSGETADTIAGIKAAKAAGQTILSIVNAPESTLVREAHQALMTKAGPEIGVASTKAFTAQLAVLLSMAIAAGRARGTLSSEEEQHLTSALIELPMKVNEALGMEAAYRTVAEEMLAPAQDVLYLGRGTSYPLALEGALKLKEISYIHAEGYAAGEMKHGPIALIAETVPVIVLAPSDRWFEKSVSNLEQVKARDGKTVLVTDRKGANALAGKVDASIVLPDTHPELMPILAAVPMQLLAFYTALARGTSIDQPRNLAKSVTVE